MHQSAMNFSSPRKILFSPNQSRLYHYAIEPIVKETEPVLIDGDDAIFEIPAINSKNVSRVYKVLFSELLKCCRRHCSASNRQSDEFIEKWYDISRIFGHYLSGTISNAPAL